MPNSFHDLAEEAPGLECSEGLADADDEEGQLAESIDREQRELVEPSLHMGPRGVPSDPHGFHRNEQEEQIIPIIKRLRGGERNAYRSLTRALRRFGLEDASSFGLPRAEMEGLKAEIERKIRAAHKRRHKGHRRR